MPPKVFVEKFFPSVYEDQINAGTSENQRCPFDSQLLTAFTSSLYVAGLISTFFASTVTRVLGQKASMLCGGAAFLIRSPLNGAAMNVAMLIVGPVLLGQPSELWNQQDRGRIPRRPLPARHPQLPGRAGQPRNGQEDSPEGEGYRRRPRGAGGHGRGERVGQAGAAPLEEHPAEALSAAARDGAVDPGFPAAHRHQHHHVLRAGVLQDDQLRGQRLAHVGRHHGACQRRGHRRVHRHRRQVRPEVPLRRGRRADADQPAGGDRGDPRREVRRGRDGGHVEAVRRCGAGAHLHLRCGVRVVVGAARVAGAERDLPAGDPIGGAIHRRLRQLPLDIYYCPVLPDGALPPQVRPLLDLCFLRDGDDALHHLVTVGDEECAH